MARPTAVPEEYEEHCKLMFDLQVMAYRADITRVITFMLAHAGSNRAYPSIGISDGHHSLTHHMNDKEKIEKVSRIDEHLVKQFALYLEKMRSTPDGDGTLLDHMIICHGSSLGDGNNHTHHDLPISLVAGTKLFPGNRHIVYPKETPLNNLFLSMFDKAGIPCQGFGDSTGKLAYL